MIVTLFGTSCSDPKQIYEVSVNSERQERVQNAVPANDVVIVRASHGKKRGKWPNQWCDGDQIFRCWRWFPKDVIINSPDPYEFENYMYMEFREMGRVVLKIPEYNDVTRQRLDFYDWK